ncbi:MAG: hypothetical protein KAT02_02260 [Candidatus Heimdallarchaeota archaeon]|nr:hypothetical protein [Candidatus Heimdallarchaeota archaeon]
MFGLSTTISTILISVCGLVVALFIIYPTSSYKKQKTWFAVKIFLIIVSLIFIILLLETKRDSFFFIGSFLGISFLLKAVFQLTELKSLSLLSSYISFTFIFLAMGQIILFILNLGFAYVLFIYLSIYKVYIKRKISLMEDNKISKISTNLFLFFASLTITGFIVYELLNDQVILLQNDSLIQIFSGRYSIIILVIFICFLTVILILIFTLDVRKRYTKRKDEPWYS